MGLRGPKSSASLSIVSRAGEISAIRRPDPPAELSDEQAEVWRRIVSSLPGDWFPSESLDLLIQYSRHVVRARRLAQLLDSAERNEGFALKDYRDLLKCEEEQSRAIASLATRMRISQQATHDRQKKKGKTTGKLWET